jgi:hypothetical protein
MRRRVLGFRFISIVDQDPVLELRPHTRKVQ